MCKKEKLVWFDGIKWVTHVTKVFLNLLDGKSLWRNEDIADPAPEEEKNETLIP